MAKGTNGAAITSLTFPTPNIEAKGNSKKGKIAQININIFSNLPSFQTFIIPGKAINGKIPKMKKNDLFTNGLSFHIAISHLLHMSHGNPAFICKKTKNTVNKLAPESEIKIRINFLLTITLLFIKYSLN